MSEYTDPFAYPPGPLANNPAWYNTQGGGLEVFSEDVAEDPGAGIQTSSIDPAFMTFVADGEAHIEITNLTGFDFVGVGYRATANNGYYLFAGDGEYNLVKIIAGAETEIGSNPTDPAVGHMIKVKCTGNTISAELDTGTGYTEIISVTDSDLASGQPSLYANRQNSNGSRMDNFYAVDANGASVSFQVAWAIDYTVNNMDLIKNTANQQCSTRVLSATDGSAVTSGVSVTVQIDGGARVAGQGTLTHKGVGGWEYIPTQAETDCDHLVVNFDAAGAIGKTREYRTSVLIDVNAQGQVSADHKKTNGVDITGDGSSGNKFRSVNA